jgi:DNA-binding beta-propeller fold protein YncE
MAWPFSVAVHPNGEIFVLDEPDEYRILRLDRAGHCLGTWVEIPATDEEGGVEDPQGLCIDAAGVVYVPDAANDRISVWNADGTFSRWIGGTGAKPGQFAHPRDVEVDEDGFLYVADSFNHRIQKLSADGVLSLNIHDLGPLGKFAEPRAITADADGNILVADGERNQVILLSSEGRPRKAWPGTDGQPCTFDGLGDVRVDPDGALYVSDRGNLRIRRLSPDGQVTGVIDRSAPETEMTEAGDIAILDGKVVIPDRFNDCVYCLAFEEPATEPPDKDTP